MNANKTDCEVCNRIKEIHRKEKSNIGTWSCLEEEVIKYEESEND